MNERAHFTDEDLTAYLDGEAPEELRKEIDAALEINDDLATRLAALDIPVDDIAGAFDALLATAPAMPDLDVAPTSNVTPMTRRARRSGALGNIGLFATGIAAGIAIAVYTGIGDPQPKPDGWKAVVASYQTLYATETLETVTPTQAEVQAQLAAVSAALGTDLSTLPNLPGLTFKRAQRLSFNGKTLIQIAYLRDDGTPVALCIIPAKGPAPQPVTTATIKGLATSSWNQNGLAYLLVGGDDPAPVVADALTFQSWSESVQNL